MNQDPDHSKDGHGAANARGLLAVHQALVARLFAESRAASWGLLLEQFEAALESSASKHFPSGKPSDAQLEEYLGALHVQDLALATACIHTYPAGWDHFVAVYRGYLRSAASAILRSAAAAPEACDLADSLFADLYGLRDGQRSAASLFRYFHGRSSLKTWLRAVLTQRHIDGLRASRRFTALDDAEPPLAQLAVVPGERGPLDPHRQRYIALFTRTLEHCLAQLPTRDSERLRLYYAATQTLANIGRQLGEHESSVSRNLERTRCELRENVEAALRSGLAAAHGWRPEPGLSEAQISLCLEYATEVAATDAGFDFDKLFPRSGARKSPAERPES